MKHVNRVTAVVAIACALLTAGCASTGGASTASAFQPGKYQNGETVAIFNTDGTFVGTTTSGNEWVRGTYQVTGNEVVMRDTWESDMLRQQMGKDCIGIAGRYNWTLQADVLTATVIDDACDGRRRGTSGVPWTRMR
ncbi:hypothetical protein [Luteimonas sp. 3794]|uniref:hypothetical protein n=1 Tax=Luteimonas sp. 3794 TaxID=2817730 RepID=UPI0028543FFA|nr:hypothetical protein [Luteimonas sp. 3794]MDR6990492.1 hypothetical protein [Luteimonas sp. 3794]